ncbi:MAG TPA: LEA type 2 family protein [Rubrivivax sp.]|nr:LEA type 2 family protein [Burkholderiaceae bacterium]HMQ73068.1 LEA type 2 family protein [Rubrivivax sp.]
MPTRRLCLTLPALLAVPALGAVGGCAGMPGTAEPPRVVLVGMEPLAGEGMELRFAVKLRVQNPNTEPLRYDGVSLDLDLRGQGFASGVAPLAGSVPAWGETVLTVPVTASAFALARQLLDFARDAQRGRTERITYALRGRLGGGMLGGARFSREGEIDLGELMR